MTTELDDSPAAGGNSPRPKSGHVSTNYAERPVRPATARSPTRFEPDRVPLPKHGWGGGKGSGRFGGGPPAIDGFAHLAPSRWKDSVVTEEQVDKMADRQGGGGKDLRGNTGDVT